MEAGNTTDLVGTIPLLILGMALVLGARLFGLLFMVGAICFLAGVVWSIAIFSDNMLLMVAIAGTGFFCMLFWRTRRDHAAGATGDDQSGRRA